MQEVIHQCPGAEQTLSLTGFDLHGMERAVGLLCHDIPGMRFYIIINTFLEFDKGIFSDKYQLSYKQSLRFGVYMSIYVYRVS
jgi:hypothetical protein